MGRRRGVIRPLRYCRGARRVILRVRPGAEIDAGWAASRIGGCFARHPARQAQNSIMETAMSQLAEDSKGIKCTPQARLISVVDDEESVREAMRSLLRSAGYRVRVFGSAENLFDSGALGETACLILDVRMPGTGGLELQEQLNRGGSRIPIIFITAHADDPTEMRARAAGAVGMLRKPFAANDMLRAVETALKCRDLPAAVFLKE